jgi:hypothetical protein
VEADPPDEVIQWGDLKRCRVWVNEQASCIWRDAIYKEINISNEPPYLLEQYRRYLSVQQFSISKIKPK